MDEVQTFIARNQHQLGYVMNEASRQWNKNVPGGAFTVGECYGTIESLGTYDDLLKKIERLEVQQKALARVVARNLVAWDTSKDKQQGLLPEIYLTNQFWYEKLTGEKYSQYKAVKKFDIGW